MKALMTTLLVVLFVNALYSQNVGINTSSPISALHVIGSDSNLLTLHNPITLSQGKGTYIDFKTGSWFTGRIATHGYGSNTSSLSFYTYASVSPGGLLERMTILDNGSIGIEGNTSPIVPLSFASGTGNKISLYGNSTASHYGLGIQGGLLQIYTNASNADIAFGYGSSTSFTENMRIKGNGNVGFGNTNPLYKLDVTGVLHTTGNIIVGNALSVGGNETVSGILQIAGGNPAPGKVLTASDVNGSASWQNPSTYIGGAGSVNYLPKFTGLTSLTNSLIYDNGSSVGINTNSPSGALEVDATTGTAIYGNGTGIGVSGSAGPGSTCYGVEGGVFGGTVLSIGVRGSAGSTAGTVYGVYGYAFGGSVNYAGYFSGDVYTTGTYLPSDRKLKKDIKPLNGAMAIINQLSPSAYKYKVDEFKQMHLPEGTRYGLIADELQKILPGAVRKAVQPAEYENIGGKRGKKLNDAIEFNAVNYNDLIPILVSAVKEQNEIINGLLKRIEMLEKK